ncbi:MAG: glycosyltransferase family 2 protein [Planctomycetota bacterium]
MPEPSVQCDVVIPARNEAENLPALIEALRPLREAGVIRHVVVCDNGSTDDTGGLARGGGFVVVEESRPGYGGACLKALGWLADTAGRPDRLSDRATSVPVAFLDADLADDPDQLPRLLTPIAEGEADLVLGRRVPEQKGALDPHQRFGNRFACVLLRLLTGHRYRDLGPMRALTWEALGVLEMRDRTWGWTVEMQYKAATRGLRIVELDVPYRRRRAGVSKISGSLKGSVKAGVVIVRTIGALWWAERVRKPRASGSSHLTA